MASETTWVFQAGDGATPPALTGRTSQQDVLRRCLAGLGGGEAPPHNVVLLGPRGNGKTALLRWFREACAAHKPKVAVRSLTPSALPNRAALADALAPRRGIAKLLPRKVGIASVGSAEWTSSSGPRDLTEALVSRCRRRPVALLLDEAHTLPLEVGAALLNASQQVRGEAPFLLVLAGTPGLPAHLNAMDATFWSRLGEGELGIGPLSEEAARQALREPMHAREVTIEDDVLSSTVAASQCYPYFVQLWGDALWRQRLATGASAIGAAHADAVAPAVAARVANYYRQRFAELEIEGLVPAAVALARRFESAGAAEASDQEVDAALADAALENAKARLAAREALRRLGYIWQPPNQQAPVRWHAGIPSLMAHVLRQAAG